MLSVFPTERLIDPGIKQEVQDLEPVAKHKNLTNQLLMNSLGIYTASAPHFGHEDLQKQEVSAKP